MLTGSFVKIGQNVVHESIDDKPSHVVADVDQKLVPALGFIGLAGR